MSPRKHSFSAKLSFNILIVTSTLFVTMSLLAAFSSHSLIVQEAQNSTQHLLNATIKDVEREFDRVESAVYSSSWFMRMNADNEQFLYRLTSGLINSNLHIIGSCIAFAPDYHNNEHYFAPYSCLEDGRIVNKQLGNEKYDYFQMEWYRKAADSKRGIWSEPYFDEGGANALITTYSLPILNEEGNVYAIMTADVPLKWVRELTESVKPYPNSYIDLVTSKGTFINKEGMTELEGETILSLASKNKDKRALQAATHMIDGEKGITKMSYNGDQSFAVYGPLHNGWAMDIICNYKEVLARSTQMHITLVLICMIGLALLFLVCYRIIHRLTKPLTQFSDAALSIANGDFNTKLPDISSDDEIRQMRDSFDFMQKSLVSYVEDLKKSTASNERMAGELNVATKIQMGMLPKNFPHNDKVDLHAFLRPAKEVGGDLYDFCVKDDCLYFAVGDVSGKGVPAALVMAIIRSMFRFTVNMGLEIHEMIERINNVVSESNPQFMFATFFAGKLNLRTGELQYCNAGHNPTIFITADGKAEYMDEKSNMALGIWQGFKYEPQSMTMERGSRLVLYTDGVTEAERANKEQFGEDRLLEWANNVAPKCHGADVACMSLEDAIMDFTAGNEQNDDITIMTIKLNA